MRAINLLSEKEIRAAKPQLQPYKLPDGAGLYLYVAQTGGKSWRYDYRVAGKRKTLTYGQYPAISLKNARELHVQAQQQLAGGIDPASHKQEQKKAHAQQEEKRRLTFSFVALDWHNTQTTANTDKTRQYLLARLEKYIFPSIGHLPFEEVTFDHMRNIVRTLEKQYKFEMAKRVAQLLTQICRHAKINQWAEYNKAEDLTHILERRPSSEKKGFPAITSKDGVAQMLRRIKTYIDANRCSPYMQAALQLYPLTAQRARELVKATWEEIDFEAAVWRIPSEHMKKGRAHEIPLSRQALTILKELTNYRTSNHHIFPSGSKLGHITGESVNKAMHIAGIPQGEMTLHGWHKVFSTLAHEAGAPTMLIEKSLAHVSGDDVARAYDKSRHIEARRVLLQWWADYLDSLRDDTEPPRLELERTAMFA